MLKGFVITPPILGRIAIGTVVERNGKRLPQKDDQFTLTSQVQTAEGWIRHPLDAVLRRDQPDKLRRLPIRLLFNEPDLNLRAEYVLFDRKTARPLCMGNGEHCTRRTHEGTQTLPCPAPDLCPLAEGGACKPYGRLNVVLGEEDPLGSFIFRTTGFNSIRTLAARLAYFQAISGNRLACLDLALRLRGKSTRQSYGRPIFYVDLTLREGCSLEQTLENAQRLDTARQDIGFDQQALDQAADAGFANGFFEDSSEDAAAVIEEFYPEPAPSQPARSPTQATTRSKRSSAAEQAMTLAQKVQAKQSPQETSADTPPINGGTRPQEARPSAPVSASSPQAPSA
jgi:hypothetical protein